MGEVTEPKTREETLPGKHKASGFSTVMRVGKEELTSDGERQLDTDLMDRDNVDAAMIPWATYAVALALADKATRDLSPDVYRRITLELAGERVFMLAIGQYYRICFSSDTPPQKLPGCQARLKQEVADTKVWIAGGPNGRPPIEGTIAALAAEFQRSVSSVSGLLPRLPIPRGGMIEDLVSAAGVVFPPAGGGGRANASTPKPGAIDEIRAGQHQAMPPAQAAPAALGGMSGLTLKNATQYQLHVYLKGPVNQTLEIPPNQSQNVTVPPGQYEVAARVSDPSVIPFYSPEEYPANTMSSYEFYIHYEAH